MADRHQPPTYTCSHLCYSPFPPPPPEPLLQSILSLLLRHYPTPSPESAYSSLLQRIDLLESSFHRFSSPPCPDSAISLRDLAARRIQARFRAFLVRRSRGFRRLKEIVSVKCSLDDLKSSILPHNRLDSVSVSRGAVCLISRLEIIQAGDKVTRDSKSLVLRDIAEFVEQVEGICGGRNEALSREMKNKWNVDNDEKRLIDSLRERLERIPEMSEVGESEDECIGVEKLKMLLSNVEKRVRFLEDENATRVCNGSRLSGNVKMIEDAVEKHDEDSARSVGGNGDKEEPEKEVCEDEVETENEGCEDKDEAENAVSEDEDGTETTRVCNGSRLSGNVKMVEDAVEKHEDSARSVGGNGDEEEPEKEVCEDEVQTENEGSGDDWETENEACEHEYETEDEGSEVEVESENEVCEHEFETEDEGSEDCDETETEDYDDNDEDETEEEEGSEAEGESKNGIPEGNNHHGYIDDGRGNGYHGRFMRNVICHNCNTRGKVFLSHPNTNNIMAEQGGGERRLKGSVKWFDDTKGFGFITPNEGGDDLFVHHSFIRTDTDGFRSLDDGEEVEFVIEKGDDGRTKAVDVTGLNGAPIQGSRRGGVRGNCFSCGEPGHIARECPIGISSGHGHMSRCCPNNNR